MSNSLTGVFFPLGATALVSGIAFEARSYGGMPTMMTVMDTRVSITPVTSDPDSEDVIPCQITCASIRYVVDHNGARKMRATDSVGRPFVNWDDKAGGVQFSAESKGMEVNCA